MTRPHRPVGRLTYVDLLTEAGEVMHGHDWRRPLAREVGVSGSLLALVASGQQPPSRRLRRAVGEYASRAWHAELEASRRRLELLTELRDRSAA